MHCNNSRDEFGSGRDRHANFASGTIDPALLLGVVRAAGAPVICETPADDGGLAADVSLAEGAPARLAAAPGDGGPAQPELISRPVEYAAGRVIVALGAHLIPFGRKNVPHHVGGEQADGEQPGGEDGEVPAGADALVAGHRVAVG